MIGSNDNATAAAESLMAVLADLRGCMGAAVYAQSQNREKLVIKVAVPPSARCRPEYHLGEGAVGKAALRRKPTRVTGDLYAVPILSRDRDLLGVLGVALRSSRTISQDTMSLASGVARLLACAMESKHIRDTARKHARLVEAIELLVQEPASDADHKAVLESLLRVGRGITGSNACAVYLQEQNQNGLHLVAVSPTPFPLPLVCPEILLRACTRRGATWVQQSVGSSTICDGGRSPSRHMSRFLAAPIWRGDAHVGVLLIVENGPCEISEEVLGFSERLAQMVGLVLRNRQLRDLAAERLRADTVLWELLDSRGETDATRALGHARRLGYRWIGPHVVLLANAADPALIDDLHHKILDLDAHVPIDAVNGSLIAIVRDACVSALSLDGVSTGISAPCADVGRLPSAYREARNALETGVKLFGPGRLTRVEDLKSYQFVPTLLKNGFADGPEYQLLSRLSDDLLKTLEVYLDAGGNATRAAKQLFLHRNTLRQRLDRISGLLAVDLAASDRWLSLQLAVKAARLARLDNSEEERSLY